MHFPTKTLLTSLLLTLTTATPLSLNRRATPVSVSYDPRYDSPTGSLSTTACSNGQNGLIHEGYNVFQDLPNFPSIGGSLEIAGWDSPQCGSCYQITYGTTSIYVTAVDTAPRGFNIALQAMNVLTGGLAEQLGRVDATYQLVDRQLCGFPAGAVRRA